MVAADQPNALPLIEAAERLGLSENALRLRIRRGHVAAHKRDGRWYVVVPNDGDQSADQSDDRSRPGGDESTTSQATSQDRTDDLIAAQREEITFLREQLDHSRRELSTERERFDVIHREALQRIEALTAGELRPESGRNSDDAPDEPSEGPGREQTAQGVETPEHQGSWLSVAWRRLTGRS